MAEFTNPHNIAYPVAADRIKDPNATAKLADDIKAAAVSANDAITTEGARAETAAIAAARWKRGTIPASVDVREFMYGNSNTGQWESPLSSEDRATLTGLPDRLMQSPVAFTAVSETFGNGTVIKLTVYNVYYVAEYTCTSAPSTGDGWTRWYEVQYVQNTNGDSGIGSAEYGFKTAALSLTSPINSSSTETVSSTSMRLPLWYGVGFKRFRVHIRNHNDRADKSYEGAVPFTGLWFGEADHATGSFLAPPTQLTGAFTTPQDGSEYVSPYFNFNVIANRRYALSMGFSPVNQTAVQSRAAVWRFTGSSTHGGTQTISWALSTTAPFDIWVEAEVPAETPIIAELASSGGAGAGSTYPMMQTGLTYLCRRVGALPMHLAHSGSTLQVWETGSAYAYHKYEACARADAVMVSVGQNDVFGTRTLEQIQASAAKVIENLRAYVSRNIFMTTIPPRATGDETKRRQYNAWLKTKPLGVRDTFDVSAALSSDDETIKPEYDADGVHANELGAQAKANAINRPMIQPLVRVSEAIGRTLTVWDYVNQREQMIYGDTGWRSVVASLPAGITASNAWIRRQGSEVTINVQALKSDTSGTVTILALLSGFRPDSPSVRSGVFVSTQGVSRVGSPFGSNMRVLSMGAGETLDGSVTFTTNDPWPTALPGVAA